MVVRDALVRELKRFYCFWIGCRKCCFDIIVGDANAEFGKIHLIEFLAKLDQCLVAVTLDSFEDCTGRSVDVFRNLTLTCEKLGELSLEVRICNCESLGHRTLRRSF